MTGEQRHGVSLAGRCRFCAGQTFYSAYENSRSVRGFDATFCDACDAWLESTCTEASCEYCAERPLKPSMVVEKRVEWPATASLAAPSVAVATEPDPPQKSPDVVEAPAEVDAGLQEIFDQYFSPAAMKEGLDAVLRLSPAAARRSHLTLRMYERAFRQN